MTPLVVGFAIGTVAGALAALAIVLWKQREAREE
jgi:hypothetical protein